MAARNPGSPMRGRAVEDGAWQAHLTVEDQVETLRTEIQRINIAFQNAPNRATVESMLEKSERNSCRHVKVILVESMLNSHIYK